MGITKLNHTTKSTYYAIYIVAVYAVAVWGRAIEPPCYCQTSSRPCQQTPLE